MTFGKMGVGGAPTRDGPLEPRDDPLIPVLVEDDDDDPLTPVLVEEEDDDDIT
jgi:hypothetical protein